MNELIAYLNSKGYNFDYDYKQYNIVCNNHELLKIVLLDNQSRLIYFFHQSAWTDENIQLYFTTVQKANSIPYPLRNTNAFLIALDLNRFDLISLFEKKLINDEIENKYIEKLKGGFIDKIIYNFQTETFVKKCITNNLLYPVSLVLNSSPAWTEENINLFCEVLNTYQGELSELFFYNVNRSDILYALIKNKRYMLLSTFNRKDYLWTDECKQLLIDDIDGYLAVQPYIPDVLKNSSILLKKMLLNNNFKFINLFVEEAWTEENLEIFININPQFTEFPYGVRSSARVYCFLLDKKYDKHLNKINLQEVTDEIAEKYIERCINDNLLILPYTLRTIDVLKKLLFHNLLYQASLMPVKCWTDENINLFCDKLNSYSGSLELINFQQIQSDKLFKSFIQNKRYEIIHGLLHNKMLWTEENIDLFLEHIPNYFIQYNSLPVPLYASSKVLAKMLEIKKYNDIRNFTDDAWTEENIRKYISLFYQVEDIKFNFKVSLEKHLFIESALYNVKGVYYGERIKTFQKIIESTQNINDDNNYSKEYKAFVQFIKQTNSVSIYLLIMALIKGNTDNISYYFNSEGPNELLIKELYYNEDYQEYCKKNNIELIDDIQDVVLLQYLKFSRKFPDLSKYVFIDKKNIGDFFDETGIKKDLYDYLFNVRAAKYLYCINCEIPQLDSKRTFILEKFVKIEEKGLRRIFFNFCNKHFESIETNDVNKIYNLLRKIENSNSSEIRHFEESLAEQLLDLENPEQRLEEIEQIFLKNNLPDFAKVFLVFKIMYPDYSCFYFNDNSTMSPILKKCNDLSKDVYIFSRLLYAQLGSNNLSLLKYLDTLVAANQVYQNIIYSQIDLNSITNEDKELLITFMSYVEMLYNNSLIAKKNGCIKINNLTDISKVIKMINNNSQSEFSVPDRIVRMFCHNAGFDTVESIRTYATEYIKKRNEYHFLLAQKKDFIVKPGYLVKGINLVKYLDSIAKYGIRCKEMLGDVAGSDFTKLDADFAMIPGEFNDNMQAINATCASGYGKTYLVYKIDDRQNFTRGDDMVDHPVRRNFAKSEIFKTGVVGPTHYGAAVAEAFSDIEYIITDEYSKNMGLILAINGSYVPVVDMNGQLLFTYDEFVSIREKMAGLSYYKQNNYSLANDVMRPELDSIASSLKDNDKDTSYKRSCIINALRNGIYMAIKTCIDGDLTPGSIEIIDTGSTGRGTNVPNDGDFDFVVRIDRNIMIHEDKLLELKQKLAQALGREYTSGDFRFEGVSIPGIDGTVDIDMTFISKTNKADYTTEMCIADRLNTIKKKYPEQYNYVISNIIMAKMLFKKYECYKPKHARKNPQGGLGGVGVENWILQNGGSLMQAAKSFLAWAQGKTFEEFKNSYPINDFGANHLAERKNSFPYDNYIFNLNEDGYKKILIALNDYVLGKVYFNEDTVKMK